MKKSPANHDGVLAVLFHLRLAADESVFPLRSISSRDKRRMRKILYGTKKLTSS